MSNPFKVDDRVEGDINHPNFKGVRGTVLQVPDDHYVVVRWDRPGCQFTEPVRRLIPIIDAQEEK